jgi:hypothetical protein
MPVTGREVTRRIFLLAAVAVIARGDAADDAWQVIASLASALSAGNASEFMDACDRQMPGYETLRINVAALLRDAEVAAAVDLVRNDGDDRARTLESDWLLRLRQRADAPATVERNQRLTCKLEKRGKKWRIVSMEPRALFDAATFSE